MSSPARNHNGAPRGHHHGAGTSAAKMKGVSGTRAHSGQYTYIAGEGWVKWAEIKRSVAKGFNDFINRRAMDGTFANDTFESRLRAGFAVKRKEATT